MHIVCAGISNRYLSVRWPPSGEPAYISPVLVQPREIDHALKCIDLSRVTITMASNNTLESTYFPNLPQRDLPRISSWHRPCLDRIPIFHPFIATPPKGERACDTHNHRKREVNHDSTMGCSISGHLRGRVSEESAEAEGDHQLSFSLLVGIIRLFASLLGVVFTYNLLLRVQVRLGRSKVDPEIFRAVSFAYLLRTVKAPTSALSVGGSTFQFLSMARFSYKNRLCPLFY